MKPLSQSAACAAKCLFAVMQYMKSNGGTVTTKEINDIIQENVKFTEWELERAGKLQNIRWWTMTQFYSIDYNKAGYILKKQGSWYLTPEGEEAIKLGAEQILRNANAAYRNRAMSPSRSIPNRLRISFAGILVSGMCFTCTLILGVFAPRASM